MGIDIKWFNRKQGVVLWVFDSQFSLEEFHKATRGTWRATQENKNVCIIAEMSAVTTPPPKFITALRNFHKSAPPNYEITLVIGANFYTEMVFSVVGKLPFIGRKYILLPNMESAKVLLSKKSVHDDDLDVSTRIF